MNTALRFMLVSATAAPLLAFAAPELVLREDVRLTAHLPSGPMSVVAGRGIARTYEWNGCSLESRMIERSSRWFGSLGIYDPAPSHGWPFSLFRICKGVSRTVVAEGQIHFAERSAAEEWIQRYAQISPTVWSNDGLLVQSSISPSREQLNVSVWQVCILGRPPTELSDANDGVVQLSRVAGSGPGRHECAAVGREVALETQKVWRHHWKQADEWNSRIKQ